MMASAELRDAVQELRERKAEFERLYQDWACAGNPYSQPEKLRQMEHHAQRMALCARALAEAVASEDRR